jgi:hypothetical protein
MGVLEGGGGEEMGALEEDGGAEKEKMMGPDCLLRS